MNNKIPNLLRFYLDVDTLYTLIRRLKPIIEEHSELKIESDRGRAYELKHR